MTGANRGQGAITRKPRAMSLLRTGYNDTVEPKNVIVIDDSDSAALHTRNLVMTPQAKGKRGSINMDTLGSREGTPENGQ